MRARACAGVAGIGGLLQDYRRAAAAVNRARYALLKPHLQARGTTRTQELHRLSQWREFVSGNSEVLAQHPDSCLQQALNQPHGSFPHMQARKLLHRAAVLLRRVTAGSGSGSSTPDSSTRDAEFDAAVAAALVPPAWLEWGNRPSRNRVVARFRFRSSVLCLASVVGKIGASVVGTSDETALHGSQLLVVGESSGAVVVLDSSTSTIEHELAAPARDCKALALAVSHDGSRLAASFDDGRVHVWNVSAGFLSMGSHPVKLRSPATALCWLGSPQPTQMAFGCQDGRVAVLGAVSSNAGDRSDVRFEEVGPSQSATSAAVCGIVYRPVQKQLVVSHDDGRLRCWDASSPGLQLVSLGPSVVAHTSGHTVLAMTRAHDMLATGGTDGSVTLWPLHGQGHGTELALKPTPLHSGGVEDPETAQHHGTADHGTGAGAGASVSDAATMLRHQTGHLEGVTSIAFSPSGTTLVSVSTDGIGYVWEVATRRVLHTLAGHEGPVWSVAFVDALPEADLVSIPEIATGSGDTSILLWDAQGESTADEDDVAAAEALMSRRILVPEQLPPVPPHLDKTGHGVGAGVSVGEGGGGSGSAPAQGMPDILGPLRNSAAMRRRAALIWARRGGMPAVNASVAHTSMLRPVAPVGAHACPVLCSTMTPDGRFAATGGADGEIKLWCLSRVLAGIAGATIAAHTSLKASEAAVLLGHRAPITCVHLDYVIPPVGVRDSATEASTATLILVSGDEWGTIMVWTAVVRLSSDVAPHFVHHTTLPPHHTCAISAITTGSVTEACLDMSPGTLEQLREALATHAGSTARGLDDVFIASGDIDGEVRVSNHAAPGCDGLLCTPV